MGRDLFDYGINNMMKEIYLAGGCFWGTQHFLKQINGVISTEVGMLMAKYPIQLIKRFTLIRLAMWRLSRYATMRVLSV